MQWNCEAHFLFLYERTTVNLKLTKITLHLRQEKSGNAFLEYSNPCFAVGVTVFAINDIKAAGFFLFVKSVV